MSSKITVNDSGLTRGLWLILIAVLVILPAKLIWKAGRRPAPQHDSSKLPVFGQIPVFHLIERSGKAFGLSDLQGKVWVADFIFTHCAGPCPLISAQMNQLARQFKDESRVHFVSFSVDPDRDSPAVLSQYAERYQADSSQWLFLTGSKVDIYRLTQQHFHLGVTEIPPEQREAADQSISHSTKLVLVDGAGRIRGYYDSQDKTHVDQLVKNIRTLLKSP